MKNRNEQPLMDANGREFGTAGIVSGKFLAVAALLIFNFSFFILHSSGAEQIKISALPRTNSISDGDLILVARITGGVSNTLAITKSNLLSGFTTNGNSITNLTLAGPTSSVLYNSNGVLSGSSGFVFTNGAVKASNIWDKANVLFWGADKTGASDSSAAFTACISNAPAAGSVFVPEGIYLVKKIEIRKPLTLRGENRNATLLLNATGNPTNNWILKVDVDTNATYSGHNQSTISAGGWNYGVVVENLLFDGNYRTNHGSGLVIGRTEFSHFRNLAFYGIDGPAIFLDVGSRQLDFFQIEMQYCGSWITSGGRSKWPGLYVKAWATGDGFDAVNDLKFFDLTAYWSFAKQVEINSIAATEGGLTPTRFIKFFGCTFHGGATDTNNLYGSLMPQFNMTQADCDLWAAGYDENAVKVNGESQDVSFYNTLFVAGGRTNSFIYYQNCKYAHVSDCHFLGKVDSLATTNFAGLYFDADGANQVGSYQLDNVTIDLPSTALTSCIPYVVTAAVQSFTSVAPVYNEFLQEALLLSDKAAELQYDREFHRWTAKQGGTYNGSERVLTYSTNAPTSKRDLDVWLDSTVGTNKVAQLWFNERWNPVLTGADLNTASNVLLVAASNRVQVAAGSGISVDAAGSAGRMTYTVNNTGGGGTNVAGGPVSSVQYNSNGVFSGSSGFVFTNGNLGIGTTAPAQKLHVIGNTITSQTNFADYLYATNGIVSAGTTAGKLTLFGTNGTTRSTIAVDDGGGMLLLNTNQLTLNVTNGNVGIGPTVPTKKLHVGGDTIRLDTAKTPASAAAAGLPGEICWDASFVYVCVATNTWKRSAIATW